MKEKSGKLIIVTYTDRRVSAVYKVHKITFTETFCVLDLTDGTTLALPKDFMQIEMMI